MNLGHLAHRNGHMETAEEGWRAAAESGHPEHAPTGAYGLGALLHGTGRVEEAVTALRYACSRAEAAVFARASH